MLTEAVVDVLNAAAPPLPPQPPQRAPGPAAANGGVDAPPPPAEPELPGAVAAVVVARWRTERWAWREHQRLQELMRWRGSGGRGNDGGDAMTSEGLHGLTAEAARVGTGGVPPPECIVS